MVQNTILSLRLFRFQLLCFPFSLYLFSEGFVFYLGPNQLEMQFQTLRYLIVFSIFIPIQ